MLEKDVILFHSHDYSLLKNYFKEYQNEKKRNFPKAEKAFEKFEFLLKHHITWEENILFPFYKEKIKLQGFGPTDILEQQHKEILQALLVIESKVDQNNTDTDKEEELFLIRLIEHHKKEDAIVYDILEKITSKREKDAILSRMNEFHEDEQTPYHAPQINL